MEKEPTKEAIENNDLVTVSVGEVDLRFKVSTADFNQYLNENLPHNKVSPAYNLLQRTIVADDKDAFKAAVLRDNLPNGGIVMQIAGVVAEQFGAGVEISIKK